MMLLAVALIALVGWRFSANKKQAEALQAGAGGGGGQQGGGGAQGGGARGGAGGGAGGGGRQTPTVELAVAKAATIEERLEAVGSAESPLRVELSPRSSGRILTLSVREGDAVTKGQALVTLDPADLEQRVVEREAAVAEARSRLAQARLQAGPAAAAVSGDIQQARAVLSSAQANLAQLQQNYDSQVAAADAAVTDQQGRVNAAQAQIRNNEAALAREKASLINMETRYARLNTLLQKGYVAGQEVDDARTAVDVQKKEVDVAEAELSSAKSALGSAEANLKASRNQASIVRRKGTADIQAGKAVVTQRKSELNVASANRANTPAYEENLQALQASLEAVQSQVKQARTLLAEAVLRSTVDGVVTARNADPGALASPGSPVLVVQTLDWMYVVTAVPLEDSGKVTLGQTARITFDALGDRVFTATVSNINPAANVQSRQVQIRLRLDNPGRVIKPGMFAKVGFVTKRTEAAVAVPREAVRTAQGATTVATVSEDGTAAVVSVEVGVGDDKRVQILSGVKPGDKVVTLSFTPVRDGQKVQTAEQARAGRGGGRRGGGGQ